MAIVSLDQKSGRVHVSSFEIENRILFEFFNKIGIGDRDEQFHKALYIGVLALMEDRLSSFFSRTSNELGTELESLKLIFDMKKELFYRSSVKGVLAEEDIAEFLVGFLEEQRLPDRVELTGDVAGRLHRNKTGDIVCYLNGDGGRRIAIECKFDKGIRLGDIQSKDVFTRKSDTAWSQLLEAQANRDGRAGIIVFDLSLVDSSILNAIQDVRFVSAVGFVAIIDSQKGDYKNLAIAYMLARDVVLNTKEVSLDVDVLNVLLNRIIKDLVDVTSIKALVYANINNCKKIISQIEKSMLLMEFSQRYFVKFLAEGTLSKRDLLEFYAGEEVRDRFRLIEREINELAS
ncbi:MULTISPECIES: hypothetical protein [unclassified Mesorhizobium]|uniref:hypothetical protein n=2 Tax=Mesorhizobium TaxID=68287 RepID=UPI000FCA6797|nr:MULTISPECIES: hypothetical protein [unclassified Mesorhizobium]RUZ29383.1 hypothetical protein EN949_03660 [Mesorhizobium sp. M7A.F.Ca.US.007.01.2.1]RUZ42399.1 hypothetical protein EN948_27855 [Mesorhizobium sp. M7A.F.Ca.US.003.02.1.1]RUZ69491.1 hypothetical protein EN947_30845 [Mesorhizobium sp. M7A.F.Ca.US.003.02.2.1]RUZ69706.1 hypothetical protein EN950_03510 [Mesorhizobium sp. M7A.F.Ca.US.007.01.1.1]